MKKSKKWIIFISILIISTLGVFAYLEIRKIEQKKEQALEERNPERFLILNHNNNQLTQGLYQEFTGTIHNTAQHTAYHDIVIQISYYDNQKNILYTDVGTLNKCINSGDKKKYNISFKRKKILKVKTFNIEIKDANFSSWCFGY